MSTPSPDMLNVAVGTEEIGVLRWPGSVGAPVVFAVHGLTGNAWCWSSVAHALDGEITLVSIDLRGRGRSRHVPGAGIFQHARDVAAVIDTFGTPPALVMGHSMGAFVALAVAHQHPAKVSQVVLVSGGLPIAIPAEQTPQEALDRLAGPALKRLQQVFPDRVSYQTMWTTHPALGDKLTPEMERYLLSDLEPCPGGFRSNVDEETARIDGFELLCDQRVAHLIDQVGVPTTIIQPEHGVMPNALAVIDPGLSHRYPHLEWRVAPDSSHYSVQFDEGGIAAITDALRRGVTPRG